MEAPVTWTLSLSLSQIHPPLHELLFEQDVLLTIMYMVDDVAASMTRGEQERHRERNPSAIAWIFCLSKMFC